MNQQRMNSISLITAGIRGHPMFNQGKRIHRPVHSFLGFLLRVGRNFMGNKGLLLAGAVAYHTLLSIVPMSILALVALTHLIDQQQLIQTLSRYLEMAIPGYAATLTQQVQAFLEHRAAIGFIGFLGLLSFSSLAVSMMQSAMSVIFSGHAKASRRNFLLSAIIPYGYVFVMGLGIVLVSTLISAIDYLESRHLVILGWSLNLGGSTGAALYSFGIVGEVLLFTSFYLVLPVVRVELRHALSGGLAAAVLWEITRRVLVWYYASISMVNVIYGSIAITIVALLSIEMVALILLLGAQVIAEMQPDASVGDRGPAPAA
jgi:membrane protein